MSLGKLYCPWSTYCTLPPSDNTTYHYCTALAKPGKLSRVNIALKSTQNINTTYKYIFFLQSECSFFFVVIFDMTAVAPAPTVLAVPVTTAPAVPTTPELTLYVVPATHLTPDTPAPTVLDPDYNTDQDRHYLLLYNHRKNEMHYRYQR